MLSPVRLSVCRLSVYLWSVTFVRPTQAVQIFGNISTALGTLAIRWHLLKISRRSSQGTLPPGDLNTRGIGKYSDFGPIDGYISETVQDRRLVSWSLTSLFITNMAISETSKIGGKLLLSTNRKSYISFRLVQKSVTLNDLERRNDRYFALFQRIPVASAGALRKSSRSLSHLLMSSC